MTRVLQVVLVLLVLFSCDPSTVNGTPACTAVVDSSDMRQCGGPLLRHPTVVAIYWAHDTIYHDGPTPGTLGPGSADHSLVGEFLRQLGGSAYWSILQGYGVDSLRYAGVWADSEHATRGSPTGAFVSQADLEAMLRQNVGRLPHGPEVVYVLFFPPEVTPASGFGSSWCATHNATAGIPYVIIPYTWETYCSDVNSTPPYLSPNDNAPVDAVLGLLAHELAEAVTDPVPPTGWIWGHAMSRSGAALELADRCLGQYDPGVIYMAPNGGIATVHLGARDYWLPELWVRSGAGHCGVTP